MNLFEKREREEQEAADCVEEARVDREEHIWRKERALDCLRAHTPSWADPIPPYLFADERSQLRAEDEVRFSSPIDDYAAWQDEPVGAEERFR